ncbi:class I SAM-dependent methyltransferase, partial [bacterium]
GKGMRKYEALFAGKKYVTLDKEAKYQPDLVGDVHAIPLPDSSVDAVICKAVLEHVEEPGRAVGEIYRILRPGGKALFYVPFIYPYHAEKGVYKDFYRFSKDAVEYLFRDFSKVEYIGVRGRFETLINFLPFGINRVFARIGRLLDAIFKKSGNQVSGYNIFVIK